MVVMNSLGVGTTSGYGDSRASIYGTNGSNDAAITMAKEDGTDNPVFSVLPWDSQVYISAGTYYSNAAWVQDSDTAYNQLFVLDPGGGARWYASNNAPTVWWGLASDIQLWDDAACWRADCVGGPPSSRNLKENFTPLDLNDILQRISELEITRWNYKEDEDSITHIGPVAEDFYQAFGLGHSDKKLSSIDPPGVALVGVKALLEKVKVQEQQIAKLQQEFDALKLQYK